MDILDVIRRHLDSFREGNPLCPATKIFEEGWLLRWVLLFAREGSLPKRPDDRSTFFSEAQLYTAFGKRKGRTFAESHTRADGALGHITVGRESKTGLEVKPDATQFVVIEAKLYAPLSSTVTNARFYDQAARTVACMAEVLRRANRCPQNFEWLGFYVMAPKTQIDRGIFNEKLEKGHIKTTIAQRIAQFAAAPVFAELLKWQARWVNPLIECCEIACISWEDSIERIRHLQPDTAVALQEFYELCKQFNAPPAPLPPPPREPQADQPDLNPPPPQAAGYEGYLQQVSPCNVALQAQLRIDLRRYCRWDTNSMTVGHPGLKPIRVWNARPRREKPAGEYIKICGQGLDPIFRDAGFTVLDGHEILFPQEVDQDFVRRLVEAFRQVLTETQPH